jgi:hypothetical protein
MRKSPRPDALVILLYNYQYNQEKLYDPHYLKAVEYGLSGYFNLKNPGKGVHLNKATWFSPKEVTTYTNVLSQLGYHPIPVNALQEIAYPKDRYSMRDGSEETFWSYDKAHIGDYFAQRGYLRKC